MVETRARRQAVRSRRHAGRGRVLPRLLLRARQVGVALLAVVLVGGTVWLSGQIYSWLDRPIEEIVLAGDFTNFSQQDLAAAATPVLSGGFLSMDLDLLVQAIEQQAWVETASVARVWPNRLQIRVVEHQPVMRWADQGLLDDQGELIRAAARRDYKELPVVFSEQTTPRELMTQYRILATALEQADLRIHELRQRASGDWFVRLDNGIGVELGSTDLRRKIQRVIRVWQLELQAVEAEVAGIDARYTHGLVVSWQTGSAPSGSNS